MSSGTEKFNSNNVEKGRFLFQASSASKHNEKYERDEKIFDVVNAES